MEGERLRTFILPHCAAHVKGKTHLAKSFEKQYRRCQERENYSLFYWASITGAHVCVFEGFACNLDESWTFVNRLERPLQVWLVSRACLLMLLKLFVFPLLVGGRVRKDGFEKERLFKNQLGECRQGSASWLCGLKLCPGRFLQVDYSALSHGKQSVEMTQSRGTTLHASLW